jgi:hypothetical protein
MRVSIQLLGSGYKKPLQILLFLLSAAAIRLEALFISIIASSYFPTLLL